MCFLYLLFYCVCVTVCIVDWICSIYLIDSAHWMCHYWICLCLLSLGSYLLDHSFYSYFSYRYLSLPKLAKVKTRDFLLTRSELTFTIQDKIYFSGNLVQNVFRRRANSEMYFLDCLLQEQLLRYYHFLCYPQTFKRQ